MGRGTGALPFCDRVVAGFEEGAAKQIVGAPFEVDDKDQNRIIIFKSQSLQIILGVLPKWL